MTGILQQSHQMYATSGIQFRDPFAPKDSYHHRSGGSWQSYPRQRDFARALTPPPDMNGVSQHSKPAYYQQEHGHRYGDVTSAQHSYRASAAPYAQCEAVQAHQHHNGVSTQPNSRPISPALGPRQPIFEESQAPSRRGSQANIIAPPFQIPRSVNDSGGSLAVLAAQITCLFWFESADILQAVEDSPMPAQPPRQLVTDAKPSTGFRKWVTTILSTTLVAQNVVLLALLFIYRLKKINPTVRGKPGSEYRLLTVALMLGNKFLDDNTYTNKTWAEVSGIVVGEVHIMEVEFLSNMKYCLFTSAEDWAKWQTLLGKFAAFFDRSQRPQPPAPILPPASSLHLPMALPSPPASNQASPPYVNGVAQHGAAYNTSIYHGPTPAPSPLAPLPELQASLQSSRKRSHNDDYAEPPPKRIASSYQAYDSPSAYANGTAPRPQAQQPSRLTLPSLAIPAGSYGQPGGQAPQLPPMTVPARAMAMVYSNASAQVSLPQLPAPVGPLSQPPSQLHSQYQSRQQSPYATSAAASPASAASHSALSLHPPVQVSPTYFLEQRNSPYRPVHHVSTLLHPPPSAAMYQRPQNVEQSQMRYQPLGKSGQPRQSGRLPYVSQNVWLDGNQQQPMTPVHQWPGFLGVQQQQHVPPQR